MLASITPLGERGRNRRWWRTVVAYVAGSVVAGSLLGGALALVGSALPGLSSSLTVALAVGAAACALGAAADLGLLGLRLPTVRRQVNEDWLPQYRGWVCGAGFGFQLGLGVVTIVTSATVYVAFALAFLSGSGPAGAAIGATFGLVRALPVFAMATATTPERLRRAHRRMQGWAGLAHRAAVAVQCAAAGAGLTAVVAR